MCCWNTEWYWDATASRQRRQYVASVTKVGREALCVGCVHQSINLSHRTLPNPISTDVVSSELRGCEATQFVVAATNENAVGRARSPRWFWLVELTCFTATQCKRNEVRWDEVRRGEIICDMNSPLRAVTCKSLDEMNTPERPILVHCSFPVHFRRYETRKFIKIY